MEFSIPGAPTDSIDLKILEGSIHLTAPTKDIEYVAALTLAWAVKPEKAEATYESGLLRVEAPFKDPMEDAVRVVIKTAPATTPVKVTAPATVQAGLLQVARPVSGRCRRAAIATPV